MSLTLWAVVPLWTDPFQLPSLPETAPVANPSSAASHRVLLEVPSTFRVHRVKPFCLQEVLSRLLSSKRTAGSPRGCVTCGPASLGCLVACVLVKLGSFTRWMVKMDRYNPQNPKLSTFRDKKVGLWAFSWRSG